MPIDYIEITGSDIGTGSLTLSPSSTEAERGDTIIWSASATDVASFEIIRKHWYVHDIFVNSPGSSSGRRIEAHIKPGLWFNWNYKYSIVWTDKQSNTHTFDPIIAIKPHGIALMPLLIAVPLMALAAFFLFRFRKFKRGSSQKTK